MTGEGDELHEDHIEDLQANRAEFNLSHHRDDDIPSDPYNTTSTHDQKSKRSSRSFGLSAAFPLLIISLLFISFLFFLFVAFSTPLIEGAHLFSIDIVVDAKIASASGSVHFGVWGFCSTGVTNT